MNILILALIFVFIIGLCIGSFLNVVILRSLSNESIVFPPSKCPKCGGVLGIKLSKYGAFIGCNNYPTCKTAYWDKPIGKECPECKSMLTQKGKKIKCSSCDYEK